MHGFESKSVSFPIIFSPHKTYYDSEDNEQLSYNHSNETCWLKEDEQNNYIKTW